MDNPVYIGLYKLDDNGFLGEGTFSTVHVATSLRIKSHKVAIKIDKNPGLNSVKHEANILSYLNRLLPNAAFIPTLYWYGSFANRTCIVTPLYKPMTPDAFNMCDVIHALYSIHKLDVVHCDIKPDNFMLTQGTNELVLIDFGLARAVPDAGVSTTLYGSPRYTSYFGYLGEMPCPRDDLISAGYVYMEYVVGFHFPTFTQMPDTLHAFDSILNNDNLQRKQQRTLQSLLSYELPKHLHKYFEYLYQDVEKIDYLYLQQIMHDLEIK